MTKKKNYTGEVTNELRKIYETANKQRIWLREWGPPSGGTTYMAAAGSIKELRGLEKKINKKIDVKTLTLGDVIDISLPGTGKTREEACRNAIERLKEYYREKGKTL